MLEPGLPGGIAASLAGTEGERFILSVGTGFVDGLETALSTVEEVLFRERRARVVIRVTPARRNPATTFVASVFDGQRVGIGLGDGLHLLGRGCHSVNSR